MPTSYQTIRFKVLAAGSTVPVKFPLDKRTKRVVGIAFTGDRPDLLILRGSLQLLIGGQEVYPREHSAKMLYPGINVPIPQRYDAVDLELGDGQVDLRYTDRNAGTPAFAAYEVELQLKLEVQ